MSDVVEKLLNDKNIPFKASGRDYLIKCLNPDHEDSNPSLRVDKISGLAHCFSCGWKRNLFKHYDVNPPITSIKIAKLKEKLTILKNSGMELEMLEGAIPYKEKFRGISSKTLKEFEAFYTNSIEKLEDRIVFPIRDIAGKIKVFVARHTLSDANPKYVYYPKHISPGCFPEKINKNFRYIILVEGIIDCIKLYDNNLYNIVSVFGTQSLKADIKNKLLIYKLQGIYTIFILFDGDKAGRDAAAELKPLIEESDFKVNIIDLPDGVDPGNMSKEDIEILKRYINEHS